MFKIFLNHYNTRFRLKTQFNISLNTPIYFPETFGFKFVRILIFRATTRNFFSFTALQRGLRICMHLSVILFSFVYFAVWQLSSISNEKKKIHYDSVKESAGK